MSSMNGPTRLSVVVCTGALVAALLLVGSGLAGKGGSPASPGETLQVQLVDTERLGVIAGLATLEEARFLGLGTTTTIPSAGWAVLVPEARAPPTAGTPLTVVDDLPFVDPNGGTWLGREVVYDQGIAWVVPLGPVLHDATLEADYNFALVVDWSQVPAGTDLTIHYEPVLTLA